MRVLQRKYGITHGHAGACVDHVKETDSLTHIHNWWHYQVWIQQVALALLDPHVVILVEEDDLGVIT